MGGWGAPHAESVAQRPEIAEITCKNPTMQKVAALFAGHDSDALDHFDGKNTWLGLGAIDAQK